MDIKIESSQRKFGFKDMIGYTLGDTGGSFINLYVDSFFLTFCTYVLGISPFYMGTLFLVSRLWDAINDPIMGSFPDRWRIGKSGDKFKPWIKLFIVPLAISGVLCFTDVSSFSNTAKHIWVSVAYILYGMCYTGTSMPYGSMAAVITQDPVERTKLSSARSLGGMIVGFGALAALPQILFDKSGNVVPSAFFKVAIVFGILSILCYIGLLTLTTERYSQENNTGSKFNYLNVLKSVVKNRPLIGVMVATVGSLLYITANSSMGTYLYKEYYNAPQILTIATIATLPITILCVVFIPTLTKKIGKRNLILYTVLFNTVGSVGLFLVPIPNPYVFLILNTIFCIGQSVFTVIIWALVTDCLDYHEWITGERNDGSMYSIYTFSRKIGSTLASTVASYALGLIGYVAGASSQPVGVAENIRYLSTGIIVVTCILELIGIGLIFNLNNKKTQQMYSELKERR
ncbi:MFS transporter [Romboutsia hominis]|uniref:MFS transporter n=1 Tax=Romboutsia hominis TaxID=1507512 RepID=UPI001F057476|nr:glycoside-pentoside-hexuronide (GPH):cation symporter [Romboutsia hominis]MCH1960102.1 glycoside-pentoside-hexuronide (GPH):cation symporter [Romboutsia hominis]MCH1969467.1 glycoside-pentoside-hexuronide (GPH):cation symporter [Romboutsia hominis]